jgi:cephalosporin-C deacetylase-like acetyl esterase
MLVTQRRANMLCITHCSETIFFQVQGCQIQGWYMIPKSEKNVPNEHKVYQTVIKYLKCL